MTRTPTLLSPSLSIVRVQKSADSLSVLTDLTVVFKTLEKELKEGGLKGLTPIDRMELAEGMAVSFGWMAIRKT